MTKGQRLAHRYLPVPLCLSQHEQETLEGRFLTLIPDEITHQTQGHIEKQLPQIFSIPLADPATSSVKELIFL